MLHLNNAHGRLWLDGIVWNAIVCGCVCLCERILLQLVAVLTDWETHVLKSCIEIVQQHYWWVVRHILLLVIHDYQATVDQQWLLRLDKCSKFYSWVSYDKPDASVDNILTFNHLMHAISDLYLVIGYIDVKLYNLHNYLYEVPI